MVSSRSPAKTSASAGPTAHPCYTRSPATGLRHLAFPPSSSSSPHAALVDPAALPNCGDSTRITGNVPPEVKERTLNTFMAYGAGDEQCFGHTVGKAVQFIDISATPCEEKQGRKEVTTVAEVVVTENMLNGAGMLHGGCIAFLIDNTPLVALGVLQNVNGVGVTQAMNILFHSPATVHSCLRITSTSVAMGGRIMSARCEIIDKASGRIVASAYINKMQPACAKL